MVLFACYERAENSVELETRAAGFLSEHIRKETNSLNALEVMAQKPIWTSGPELYSFTLKDDDYIAGW